MMFDDSNNSDASLASSRAHSKDDGSVQPRLGEVPLCSAEAASMINANPTVSQGRHSLRERIALGVFAALLLVGFLILMSYIIAGHGLNVTATSIDDVTGDMAGYDVVLFEGTVVAQADVESGEEASEGGPLSLIGLFSGDGDDASESAEQASAESGAEAPGYDVNSVESANPGIESSTDDVMTLDEACAIYEGKNASVITLDVYDLRRYANGRVIMKSDHVYGIFSLTDDEAEALQLAKTTTTTTRTTTVTTDGFPSIEDTKTTTRVKSAYGSVSELLNDVDPDTIDPELIERIEAMLEHFKAVGVDTVIALTPDPRPFSVIDGVDVVISVKQQELFASSEMVHGTLYFDAPEQGSIGVLMIAPGNVASTKVLDAS